MAKVWLVLVDAWENVKDGYATLFWPLLLGAVAIAVAVVNR